MKLLSLFEKGIDERIWVNSNGFYFPAFNSTLNGLVLIFHINQHLREGLGLRQIIDWCMFINSVSEDIITELLPLLKHTRMEKLALTVTAFCQMYLGLKKTIPGCESIEPQICENLKTYIIEKGNFGIKAGMRGKMASFSLLSKSKSDIFKRLQIGGLMYVQKA